MRRACKVLLCSLGVLGLALGLQATLSFASSQKSSKTKATAKQAAPSGKVDLNTASEGDLKKLPGVYGPTAKKIIAGRPYKSVDDLAKAGLSASKIKKITPYVTVGGNAGAASSGSSRPAASAASNGSEAAPAMSTKGTKAAKGKSGAPEEAAYQPPPSKGMVWVNLNDGVFHREGDRWYGKTKNGKYMSEADALKAGYREAKHGAVSKK